MLWMGTRGTAASTRWVARLGVLSLLSSIILGEFDFASSFFLLHTRFWELAAGVLLAQSELLIQAVAAHETQDQTASKRDAREILPVASQSCFVLFSPWERETLDGSGTPLSAMAASF